MIKELHRQHMREKISNLDRTILNLGMLVDEAMDKAVTALLDNNLDAAQKVIDDDVQINNLELKIQDEIIILIATEQPVASDLRHVITSFKIIAQLERMGDHAVHIGKQILKIGNVEYIKPIIDLPEMAELGRKMLKDALNAFAETDSDLAKKTAALDDKVDKLRDQVNRELMTYMMESVNNFNQVNNLMFINRWLERFADHVTNICEWIIYDADGEYVELNL